MIDQKSDLDVVMEIPVLCRFWTEDQVWNGEAVDLPVAVFGETFESAQDNLFHAVISHLEALEEIGKLEETARRLRSSAKQRRLTLDEMGSNQPFVRFNAGVQDHRVFAIG